MIANFAARYYGLAAGRINPIHTPTGWAGGPRRVKTGKAHYEHMFSALPLRADLAQYSRHVRFVPGGDIG